jgi:hypothetical protein
MPAPKLDFSKLISQIPEHLGSLVLTEIYADDGTVFVPSQVADELAQLFRERVNIAGAVGVPS